MLLIWLKPSFRVGAYTWAQNKYYNKLIDAKAQWSQTNVSLHIPFHMIQTWWSCSTVSSDCEVEHIITLNTLVTILLYRTAQVGMWPSACSWHTLHCWQGSLLRSSLASWALQMLNVEKLAAINPINQSWKADGQALETTSTEPETDTKTADTDLHLDSENLKKTVQISVSMTPVELNQAPIIAVWYAHKSSFWIRAEGNTCHLTKKINFLRLCIVLLGVKQVDKVSRFSHHHESSIRSKSYWANCPNASLQNCKGRPQIPGVP